KCLSKADQGRQRGAPTHPFCSTRSQSPVYRRLFHPGKTRGLPQLGGPAEQTENTAGARLALPCRLTPGSALAHPRPQPPSWPQGAKLSRRQPAPGLAWPSPAGASPGAGGRSASGGARTRHPRSPGPAGTERLSLRGGRGAPAPFRRSCRGRCGGSARLAGPGALSDAPRDWPELPRGPMAGGVSAARPPARLRRHLAAAAGSRAGPAMPHFQAWEEFTRAAEKLYLADPMKVRVVLKYRHCDGNLCIKVTDDVASGENFQPYLKFLLCDYETDSDVAAKQFFSAVQGEPQYSALFLSSDLEKNQISSFQEKWSGVGISSAWKGCETSSKSTS
uniref:Uncharacterized protein n=2 Tax=Sylvioidea TaxID=2116661 RepID=A0A8C3R1Y6_9PASS